MSKLKAASGLAALDAKKYRQAGKKLTEVGKHASSLLLVSSLLWQWDAAFDAMWTQMPWHTHGCQSQHAVCHYDVLALLDF